MPEVETDPCRLGSHWGRLSNMNINPVVFLFLIKIKIRRTCKSPWLSLKQPKYGKRNQTPTSVYTFFIIEYHKSTCIYFITASLLSSSPDFTVYNIPLPQLTLSILVFSLLYPHFSSTFCFFLLPLSQLQPMLFRLTIYFTVAMNHTYKITMVCSMRLFCRVSVVTCNLDT